MEYGLLERRAREATEAQTMKDMLDAWGRLTPAERERATREGVPEALERQFYRVVGRVRRCICGRDS